MADAKSRMVSERNRPAISTPSPRSRLPPHQADRLDYARVKPDRRRNHVEELTTVAPRVRTCLPGRECFAQSDTSKDAPKNAQAIVKVMACRELGFGPIAKNDRINIQ